jgi:hypothetical protein
MFDFITDDSFDVEKTKQYILSIQVSLDGFSFLIIHPSEKRIVAFKSTPLKISSDNLLARRFTEWIESEELLKKQFKSVRLFIFTESFTLVPEEYLGEGWHQDLTSVLFHQNPDYKIMENKIEALNARLIFPLPSDFIEVFQLLFNNNIEIIHPVTKLLQTPLESKKRNCAIIISTKKYFFLIITRLNEVLLANSFQMAHQNDLVYNVLNTFQQLKLARSETDLFVTGSITQNTEIEDLLKPFFDNISILKTEGLITNPEIINHSLHLHLTTI